MKASLRLESKYPVIENERWTKSRKMELLEALEDCTDDERVSILKRLNLSDSEIWAIKDKHIHERPPVGKTVSEIWEQVADLVQRWTHRTDIEEIEWHFTKQEQETLGILKLYNWKVVDKQILHNAIERADTEEKLVDVIICKIRAKLSTDCPYEIETVWWRWYRLVKKEA